MDINFVYNSSSDKTRLNHQVVLVEESYYFKSAQLGLLLTIDNTELGLGKESVISFQHMQQKLPQSL
jgi:hypothetical protein